MKFVVRLRGIPIADWVTHCRISQKLHLNPFLEYSATSMSCNKDMLFKLRMVGDDNMQWLRYDPTDDAQIVGKGLVYVCVTLSPV